VHDAEELPGVRGEGLNVPALPFGIERVERECGFAGAGDTGDDDELVAGDLHTDIFEVVLAGTFDDDIFHLRGVQIGAGIYRSEDWGW